MYMAVQRAVCDGFTAPSMLQSKGLSSSFSSGWKPYSQGRMFSVSLRRFTAMNSRWGTLTAFCSIVTDTSPRGSPAAATSIPKSRRLILLRHGKSSWSDPSLKDHDRHLNEHGRSASASLASKLRVVGWLPDLILCSDSTRTRETLDIMEEHVPELEDVEVHFLGSFYSVSAMDGQTAQHLQETICKFAREDNFTVMCMGHNRGWEEAASIFSGISVELKTANAALLETQGQSWEEAFRSAGLGGWTLSAIVKPDGCDEP